MSVIYNEKTRVFYLSTKNSSYVMALTNEDKLLQHIYYGKRISDINCVSDYLKNDFVSFAAVDTTTELMLENILLEFAFEGGVDLRTAAYAAECEGLSVFVSPKVKSWQIINGRINPEGMPHIYTENDNEAQTLKITFEDNEITVSIYYTVFEEFDVITRFAIIENASQKSINIKRAMSLSVDFEESDYDFLHLHGSWGRERCIERSPIMHGIMNISSNRGSSSHMHNPFFALAEKNTTEQQGNCYGFSLVYSGSFTAGVEKNHKSLLRVFMGINPEKFSWKLLPGEKFTTPEGVMVFSSEGLGGMSRIFHNLYRERLCRGKWKNKPRPILINNWEATGFDFDEEKILNMAERIKDSGIEMFVIDDGWFGKRNDDKSSLGDWFENSEKLPAGIKGLSEKLKEKGLKTGLWFEPEMISPDSNLFKEHPDWHIHIPGRDAALRRNQWMLDLSRGDVQDYIIESVSRVLNNSCISYVKWDMNRNMAELGSAYVEKERTGEIAHRYILGLYRVLEELTSAFPAVLFEGCSGGGGRFDPGILFYMPQIWTSDCTDPVERLKIQYGTSLVYPVSSMGAHVSVSPNHQTKRITSFKLRCDVAMQGQLGYELDPLNLSEEELEEIPLQIALYKKIRETVHYGDMYRIFSPFEKNVTVCNYVSKDKKSIVLFAVNGKTIPQDRIIIIKLYGIEDNDIYVDETGKTYGGDILKNIGIRFHFKEDYESVIKIFERVI